MAWRKSRTTRRTAFSEEFVSKYTGLAKDDVKFIVNEIRKRWGTSSLNEAREAIRKLPVSENGEIVQLDARTEEEDVDESSHE